MINVVDRVPTYPNRIKVTKSDGTSEYVTWERADEPTVVGTPINKALFDSIVEDIGLNKTTTVYVSTAGSDALGDGTAANPYATITKALGSLPKNLNGFDATINIASGVYDEDVLVSRVFGGNIIFGGSVGASVAIRSLRVYYSSVVRVQNIMLSVTGVSNANSNAVTVDSAVLVCVTGLTVNGNAENGVYLNNNGFACVFGVFEINNATYSAVAATNNSSLFASSIVGSINSGAFLRSVNGSSIAYYSLNATAPVLFSTTSGGRIYSGAQTSIPNY